MQHEENQFAVNASEVIFSITMEIVLSAIGNRLGDKALTLSVDDLYLARDLVRAAIEQNQPYRNIPRLASGIWGIFYYAAAPYRQSNHPLNLPIRSAPLITQ
jgi:hypothetical protein